jgi:hypothetical protein
MSQEIQNQENKIENQLNIKEQNAPIFIGKKTRWSKRFEKLNQEVLGDSRYEGVMEELKYYLTKIDGVDMPKKLEDGGFDEQEVWRATIRKENFWKKLERTKFFESSQWINSQLFAKIKMDFEQYIERPLIKTGASKDQVLDALVEKIVKPVLALINDEGESDEILNYTAEDVYGMIFFLTGKCHINWTNYDNI